MIFAYTEKAEQLNWFHKHGWENKVMFISNIAKCRRTDTNRSGPWTMLEQVFTKKTAKKTFQFFLEAFKCDNAACRGEGQRLIVA